MLNGYLIVEKSALPDFFLKVVFARKLIESGECAQVSEAVKRAGISRSTYYKYKDKILQPTELPVGRKAVLSMLLSHEPGALTKVLGAISACGASVLTITQSLPINGQASVTVSIDLQKVATSIDVLVNELTMQKEAENVRLVAIE